MEKKINVFKFVPSLVVKLVSSGEFTLVTSSCLYDDYFSANECMYRLGNLYANDKDYEVIRLSVVRKTISMSFDYDDTL